MCIRISNVIKLAIGATLALTLVGCSPSSEQSADCSYYHDSANVLLGAYYELQAIHVPRIQGWSLTSDTKLVIDSEGEALK